MQDQAIAWIARLRSDSVSEEDKQQFALWLAASPEHRKAMDTMQALWADLEVIRELPLTAAPRMPHRRHWVATGFAAAAALVLALFLSPQLGFYDDRQEFRTRVGEQLAVELADGSTIDLNTNSHLRVELDDDARRIFLVRGEAYFAVAKDPNRPFVVEAGNAEVRALGTAFNIYLRNGHSEVIVTEGVVRVTELNAPNTRPADSALLYVDQSIASGEGGLAAPTAVDSNRRLAWREGKIVADGMTLSTLVRELSRYHPKKIIIADPDLGLETVGGVFNLENPDSILLALEHSHGVRSVSLEDGSIQLIRSPL
jgi:transmembrane sensor